MKFSNRLQKKSELCGKAAHKLFVGLLLLLLITAQTTVIPAVNLFYAAPNLVFVFCVGYGVETGGLSAIFFSTAAGFLLDMLNGRAHGIDALLYLYISLGCVFLHDVFYGKSLKITMLCVFVASVLYGEAVFGINVFLWGKIKIGFFALTRKITVEALYNVIVALIFYPFLCKCVVDCGAERDVYRE